MEIAQLITDVLRIVAWPLLVGALLLAYRRPVRRMIDSLALKFSQASKLSIWTLSLEIEQQARQAGDPSLATQVGNLSGQAIQELMQTPTDGYMQLLAVIDSEGTRKYGLEKDEIMNALQELEEKGFVRFNQPLKPFLNELRKLRPDPLVSDREWFVTDQFPAQEADPYVKQGYELTELGRNALGAIVKAVASQLTQGNELSRSGA